MNTGTNSPQSSSMMEGIFFGVLCLSGCLTFSTCLLHQYHFVSEAMTWTEAQSYCRGRYTDLATIENTEEMKKLKDTVSAAGYSSKVWIGLYSQIDWKWSDGFTGSGGEYRNWHGSNPDFHKATELCVTMWKDGRWSDYQCQRETAFVCYKGTLEESDFVVVNTTKTWTEAQRHCREHYTDLVTVRNKADNDKIHNLMRQEKRAWIGLYRDPQIYWSDGSGYSFSSWYQGLNELGSMKVVCGVADLQQGGKWRLFSCEERFPFVCYSVRGWWCHPRHVTVKQRVCSLDIELVAVGLRPYYLLREFTSVFAITVYIPPSGNAEAACDVIHTVTAGLQRQQPGAFIVITGCLTFSTCLLHQYHFVSEATTWTEAQCYCRGRYTDLATIETTEEMKKLKDTVSAAGYSSKVWIGLYSQIDWKWSDGFTGSGAEYRNWERSEPNNHAAKELCVGMWKHGRWFDDKCHRQTAFVCYKGTLEDSDFVVVNTTKNWTEAQRHCREHYTDLVTVRNKADNDKIQNLMQHEEQVWIGLYRDPQIYWSDGSGYSFSSWYQGLNKLGSMKVICGVADLQQGGKWRLLSCEERFPFVCYSVRGWCFL
ncbi:macrophage mannose receptor 1-like [Paralichthys olivaceus]|uniref:macrophage mannose receptor 1-like n=1 Tax=Paralichthys olivaceus TaxID=8255 RepID=UPI00375035A1